MIRRDTSTASGIHAALVRDAVTTVNKASGLPTWVWNGHADAYERTRDYGVWCLRQAHKMITDDAVSSIDLGRFPKRPVSPEQLKHPGARFIDEWRERAEESGLHRDIPAVLLVVFAIPFLLGIGMMSWINGDIGLAIGAISAVPLLLIIQQILRWWPAVGPDAGTPPWLRR